MAMKRKQKQKTNQKKTKVQHEKKKRYEKEKYWTRAFSEAIKKYQREIVNMNTPDGVINKGNETQKKLKENIQEKCLKPNNS